MRNLLSATALLAALLFASDAAQAQQTIVKTKTKSARNSAQASAAPIPATPLAPPIGGPAGPPVDGPEGPDGGPGHGPKGHRGPKGEHGPGGPRGGQVQVLSDVRGTLAAYQALNDEQVYDAFVLRPEGGAAPDTVHFPRHLGQQLRAAARAGSAVTVTGFRQTDPRGRSRFHFVGLASGGQTVTNAPPARPATPPTDADATATVRGTVRELRRGPNGRVRSLVLSDQTVLQLPPHAVEQLADKLTAGASLEATGTVRAARPGEALATASPARVVHAETLTLGGTKFLVR